MKDLISVIIPVYNVEKYIDKCLKSIVNQTYKEIEIIIIDDGSTDSSSSICDKYANSDSRIKVYHQENKGLSNARNLGIKKSNGKYLIFIDSDDFVSLDIIEFLYDSLVSNNADISTCMYKVVTNNKVTKNNTFNKVFVCNNEEALEKLLYQKKCSTHAWGKLFKKELFINILFPEGEILEDYKILYLLFFNSKKVVINTICKYFYLKRNGSIMNSEFNINRMIGLKIANEQTNFFKQNFPNLIKASINREFMEAIYILINMPISKFSKEFQKIKTVIKKNRRIVLLDNKSIFQYRIYALFSYLGLNTLVFVHKIYYYIKVKILYNNILLIGVL